MPKIEKIHLYDKILSPLLTEKSTNLSGENKIVFKVRKSANKKNLKNNIEKILDEISFTATDRSGEKITINKEYINENLDNLVKDTDLSKFIL